MPRVTAPRKTVIEYESPDGEWFTLAGPKCGDRGVILTSPIEDFYDVGIETIYNATAFGKGERYGGFKYPARRMSFSVDISDYNGVDWESNDSAWGQAWFPDRPGKLWFTTPRSRRWITVAQAREMKFTPPFDPQQTQGEGVVMSIIAGDPFYYSDPIQLKFKSTISTLAADASSPTGYKTQGGYIRGYNQSHLAVFPQWRVQAPGIVTLPDYSFGDDRENRPDEDAGRLIEMAETISNEHLLVNTDRSAWGGMYNTALRTPYYIRMGMRQFCYPFPAKLQPTDLYVEVSKAPAGIEIELYLEQPWGRPWGMQ